MKCIRILVLVGIFILITTPFTFANDIIRTGTQPSFEWIDRSAGLSNLSVSSIIQDRDGFIWFGTQGGLNRYDGRSFLTYTNDPYDSSGLIHNLIQTMYYDDEAHVIWIGTYQGLARFDIATNTFKNYTMEEHGLSNSVVVAIEKDKNGDIWAGTLDGLNRIDVQTNTLTKYPLSGKVVRDLLCDSNGRLWIGSYDGLMYYDEQEDVVKASGFKLPSPSVMVVNEFDSGILSLGLWDGGIIKINLETLQIENKTFTDNRVYSYVRTTDGTEWIGTWGGGLFAITKENEVFHYTGQDGSNQLSHPIVYSMLQDHTGVFWIGTNGGGINKVNPLKRNYVTLRHIPDDQDSLSAGKINAIEMDKKGNLWIAVYNEGLNRVSSTEGHITKFKADQEVEGALKNSNVVSILKSKSGDLLYGAGNIIYRFSDSRNQFIPEIVFESEVIVYAMENGANDDLWIGTYGNGLFHYDLSSGEKTQYHVEGKDHYYLSDNLVYDILLDTSNRLWVTTNNGLNLKEKEKESFRIFKSVAGNLTQLATNTIRVVFQDHSSQVWVGSVGGGLSKYNEDGTFTTYLEKEGMPSNVVLGILEGSDHRIWASTHNGLAIITPETGEIFTLTPDDGIGGYEFNSGHYVDENGMMYFGGIHGITTIPGSIQADALSIPKVYITRVDVFQKPFMDQKVYYNGETLNFKQDETFLSFNFVALDYDSPEKTRFTYRLIGFDQDWINAGTSNYITYSKLPDGNYTLEVYAETARGIRSEVEKLYFKIQAPWYRSWIAYSVYIFLICMLIAAVYKIREGKQMQLRNTELAIINAKLEEANNQLEKLSTKDPLTGVFNRRYLSVRLDEELHLAIRSQIQITLIMLDLDNFKNINDVYGHLTGDNYLQAVGNVLQKSLPRSTDFVVRFGGDEFLIVLFDTALEGAMVVAEQINKNIENIVLKEDDKTLDIQTTCSMGVVSLIPDKNTTTEEITKLADDALYEAKNQGKNKVVFSNQN